jgi:hypothetical protein
MPERWLISFRSEVWRWVGDDRELMATYDDVWLVDEHPVRFVANIETSFHSFLRHEADSGSRLLRIYWTMQVPDGMLTEDEIELLYNP